jgi:hypothetical protein
MQGADELENDAENLPQAGVEPGVEGVRPPLSERTTVST